MYEVSLDSSTMTGGTLVTPNFCMPLIFTPEGVNIKRGEKRKYLERQKLERAEIKDGLPIYVLLKIIILLVTQNKFNAFIVPNNEHSQYFNSTFKNWLSSKFSKARP